MPVLLYLQHEAFVQSRATLEVLTLVVEQHHEVNAKADIDRYDGDFLLNVLTT